MTVSVTRVRVLLLLLAALVVAVLPVSEAWARVGAPPGTPPGLARAAAHEVWMLDQGTDLIHVLDSRDDLDIGRAVTIDLGADSLRDAGFRVPERVTSMVPHMIEFDSQHRYAFVAVTAGRSTIVIDAQATELVAVLETGPASRMAAVTPFSPEGSRVYVTQRGPAPLSGAAHAAAGTTPGIAVLDAATREVLEVITPADVVSTDDVLLSDVHGVGVRPVSGDEPPRRPNGRPLDRRPSVAHFEVADRDPSLSCHVVAAG